MHAVLMVMATPTPTCCYCCCCEAGAEEGVGHWQQQRQHLAPCGSRTHLLTTCCPYWPIPSHVAWQQVVADLMLQDFNQLRYMLLGRCC
jgi:hypothetical protein